MPKKILVIEDAPVILENITAYLRHHGYDTISATDGATGLQLFHSQHPDLVILDLNLPVVSGEQVCQTIRQQSKIPMIMVTAKSLLDDKINGLAMGADDYLTKPFSPRELVARVDTLFRRIQPQIQPQVLSFNNHQLQIYIDTYQVYVNQQPLKLTPHEYKLLLTLCEHPNKAFTRSALIDYAFGLDFDGYERTIDSHIKNLRSKIQCHTDTVYIRTVRGVGYQFGGVPH